METQHLYDLWTLAKTPFDNVELVACRVERQRRTSELAAIEASDKL